MANPEGELIQWVLENRNALNLRVKKYSWINDAFPGYFDFSAAMTFEGVDVVGRGVAPTEEQAFGKALSETIERLAVKRSGAQNSNGFAAHPNLKIAQANAMAELIERDAFLCHFYTKTPFYLLHNDDLAKIANQLNVTAYLETLKTQKIELKCGLMRTADGSVAVIVAAFGLQSSLPFGLIVGCATGLNIHQALSKALISVLTNVSHLLNEQRTQPLSREEFMMHKKHGPQEHLKFALHTQNAHLLDEVWTTEPLEHKNFCQQIVFELETIKFNGLLSTAPISICRAVSRDLQRLQFGPLSESDLNLMRLRNFSSQNLKVEHIIDLIHPFA